MKIEYMVNLDLITISFLTTLISISVLRPLAIKFKLVDNPDKRKQHKGQIPLIGGISIFVGVIASSLYGNVE